VWWKARLGRIKKMINEQVKREQDMAVEYLNVQRLEDIEGRHAFHHITNADVSLLIKAVRGLHRKRQELEKQLAERNKE